MEQQTIRYDLIGAYNAGVNSHPKKHIESFGVKVLRYEGIPIADCVMVEVLGSINPMPAYIEISKFEFSASK